MPSTRNSFEFADPASSVQATTRLAQEIAKADAIVVGAGAGLSTAAGFEYSGPFFDEHFGDFGAAYGFSDLYSGGFYPFPSPQHFWAYWATMILKLRYEHPLGRVYEDLIAILDAREHFVVTTNVDHCFQRAGIDKRRLYYTQGDYGLWQCSVPCTQETYDNEEGVREMVAQRAGLTIPKRLLPTCPRCGAPMTTNLRVDAAFVQDEGWHDAQQRYLEFLTRHAQDSVVYLELGVGANTPGIIKHPFWRLTQNNPHALYACINLNEALSPKQIAGRSVLIDDDLARVIATLRETLG